MHASATHSLLSPEHRPECIPLIGPLPDEVFETADHALHDLLFGLAVVKSERRLEVYVVSPRRSPELRRGHQGRPSFEGDRGRAAGHYRPAAEKVHLHSGALLEIAEESHDV